MMVDLCLPDANDLHIVEDAKRLQQPHTQHDHNEYVQDRLHRSCHRDVSVDRPQADTGHDHD